MCMPCNERRGVASAWAVEEGSEQSCVIFFPYFMSLLAFDLVKIGANLTMTCIILFFAEPMQRLEMMFALSTIRDYQPFPFYVLACSLSVLRVLFREDTFYSCKYSAFLALFPLLLKKYHVFSHLGSAEFRNRHVYIWSHVLTLLFLLRRIVFLSEGYF